MRSPMSRLLAFSVAGVTALTAFSDDAFADRRSSLAGNILIDDQDDVYIYPQLSLEHRNLVSFDYFPGTSLSAVLGAGAQETTGQTGGPVSSNNSTVNAQPGPTNSSTGGTGTGTVDPNALGPRSEDAASLPNGPASMGGSGLILFGREDFAFGISTHRENWYGATPGAFLGVGDLQLYGGARESAWSFLGHSGPIPGSNTSPTATPTGNGAASTASGLGGVFLEPLQLADLLMGFTVGESGSMGFRLSAGQSTFREERSGPGVQDFELWNTTVIDLLVGFSMRGDFELDLNAELGLAFFTNRYETSETEPNYLDRASLAPSFSLSGRGKVPLEESVSVGFVGLLHVNTSSFNDEFGATGPTSADNAQFSSTNVMLEAGAGPVYELPDDTSVAAYGTIGFGSSSYNDEVRNFSTNALLLPGFKLALEHWMLDWLAFRTGLSSRYYFTFQSRQFDDQTTPNVAATSTFYEFLWSAGLGIDLGNFEFSGTFQTPFVTGGPDVLSGTAPGLWALLNATYKF